MRNIERNIHVRPKKNGVKRYVATVTRRKGKTYRFISRTFGSLEEARAFREEMKAEFEKELGPVKGGPRKRWENI